MVEVKWNEISFLQDAFHFFHYALFLSWMVRIRDTAVYRTNLGALGAVMETDTLGALLRVDNIDCLAFGDCFVRALRLTSPTANAFVRDLIRHKVSSFLSGEFPPY